MNTAVEQLRAATRCLYLEVHESVANDIRKKAEAVIAELDAAKAKIIVSQSPVTDNPQEDEFYERAEASVVADHPVIK